MTPSEHRASQASQQTEWRRVDKYCLESSEGYLIACTKVDNDQWVYEASSPREPIVEVNGIESFDGHEYKAHYDLGDVIPPMYDYRTRQARRSVGFFHPDQHGGQVEALDAAKAACMVDLERRRGAGPSQTHAMRS